MLENGKNRGKVRIISSFLTLGDLEMEDLRQYLKQLTTASELNLITNRQLVAYELHSESGLGSFYFGQQNKIEDLLQNRRRILVLGDAGMGKTTFLRQISKSYANLALEQIEREDAQVVCIIPYLITVKNIATKNIRSLVSKLSVYHKRGRFHDGKGMKFQALYLIDGIDEIPSRWAEKGIDRIISFVEESADKFIVASRTIFFQFFQNKFIEAGIEPFQLVPLTSEEIERICLQSACSYEVLYERSQYYGFSDMLHNPQTLEFMIEANKASLVPHSKSDLFRMFVNSRLSKNRLSTESEYYKILRDLALIMELLERNTISFAEFRSIIETRYSNILPQIDDIYDNLNRSGLLVGEGSNHIQFEHRSLGEFLASERIAGEPLNQILDFVLIRGANLIKPSWSSTLSFLIELQPQLREYCSGNFPMECLEATPSVFTEDEKKRIFEFIYRAFNVENSEFLYRTNKIKAHRLGYFAPRQIQNRLLNDIAAESVWSKANAAFLLGYVGTKRAVPALKSVAFNKQCNSTARLSALESIGTIGSITDIADIKNDLKGERDLKDHYAITIANLAGNRNIDELMESLQHLRSIVSMDVIEICRTLKTKVAMERVLDFLIIHTDYMKGHELATYVGKLLGNLSNLWSKSICRKVANLLVNVERKRIYLSKDYETLFTEAIERNDSHGQVIKWIIRHSDIDTKSFHIIDSIMGKLLTPDLAKFLVKHVKNALTLVHFAHEVHLKNNPMAQQIWSIFKPHTDGILAKQEEFDSTREHQRTKDKQKRLKQALRFDKEMKFGKDLSKIRNLMKIVPSSEWPGLDETRKKELAQLVTKHMIQTVASKNLTWISNNSCQIKPFAVEVSLLYLKIIDHYNINMPDSSILIKHIFYGYEHERLIIDYFKRNGLKSKDLRTIDGLFCLGLPEMGLRPLIQFINEFKANNGLIPDKLVHIIRDQNRDLQLCIDAFRTYVKICDCDVIPFLLEIANSFQERLSSEATVELVKRQHIQTIMKLFNKIIQCELEIPDEPMASLSRSDLDWMEHIQTTNQIVLKGFEKIIDYAIQQQKYSFVYWALQKMARIDSSKALKLVQSKLEPATDPMYRSLLNRLKTEFEILQLHQLGKMRDIDSALEFISSTKPLRKAIIFVEGIHDVELYDALIKKFCEAGILPKDFQYFIDPKGGWPNIYSQRSNFGQWIDLNRPNPVFILFDRDIAHRQILECEKIWKQIRLPYHILERRTPEKYYSKTLLRKVFGDHIPSSANEIKNRTRAIAEAMTLRDIQGTDLYEALAVKLRRILN